MAESISSIIFIGIYYVNVETGETRKPLPYKDGNPICHDPGISDCTDCTLSNSITLVI